ncbi:hypothetical protein WR25_22452 [Diploscapter pachys]|uniref:Uncharacterized protein n=1 Tax=Diploscapter pachys TaxID=2018661 RepID=A0A2A2KDT4_9BILA|nr:hypothetical protein WR25_22452 [Diploscapter pachys]
MAKHCIYAYRSSRKLVHRKVPAFLSTRLRSGAESGRMRDERETNEERMREEREIMRENARQMRDECENFSLCKLRKCCVTCSKQLRYIQINSSMDKRLRALFTPLPQVIDEETAKIKKKVIFQRSLARSIRKKLLELLKRQNDMMNCVNTQIGKAKESEKEINDLKAQITELEAKLMKAENEVEKANKEAEMMRVMFGRSLEKIDSKKDSILSDSTEQQAPSNATANIESLFGETEKRCNAPSAFPASSFFNSQLHSLSSDRGNATLNLLNLTAGSSPSEGIMTTPKLLGLKPHRQIDEGRPMQFQRTIKTPRLNLDNPYVEMFNRNAAIRSPLNLRHSLLHDTPTMSTFLTQSSRTRIDSRKTSEPGSLLRIPHHNKSTSNLLSPFSMLSTYTPDLINYLLIRLQLPNLHCCIFNFLFLCFGEGLVEIALGEFYGRQTELSRPAEQLSRVARQVEQLAVDAVVEVRTARLGCEHSVGTAQGARFRTCVLLVVAGRVVVAGCSTGGRGRIIGSVGVRPLSSPDDSSPETSPDSSPEAAPLPANSIVHYFWLNLPTRFLRDGRVTSGFSLAAHILWPVALIDIPVVDEVGRAVHHMGQTVGAETPTFARARLVIFAVHVAGPVAYVVLRIVDELCRTVEDEWIAVGTGQELVATSRNGVVAVGQVGAVGRAVEIA